MLTSMTGFAAVSGEVKGFKLSIEARSLNHRFFEFKAKLPLVLAGTEFDIEALARKYFERGRIELTATIESEPEAVELSWSRPLAKACLKTFRQMKKELKLSGPIDLQLLINQKNVILFEPERWGKECRPELERIFQRCFEELAKARAEEGERLSADLQARLSAVGDSYELIRGRSEAISAEAKTKLKKRLEQLLKEGIQLDPGRLEQEAAILAARMDISEELDRIASHLEQFRKEMGQEGARGKKLDFLSQELNREFNTISSKSQSAEVSKWVVDAKSELERIRQQLQNIE